MQIQPGIALCGHDTCDPYQRRNSILDQHGDVVLFQECDGTWHVFRDGHADGLLLASDGAGWTLTRERHTEVEPDQWAMVADDAPVCTGMPDSGNDWIARHHTGHVIVRADTLYGCIARAARHYLRTSD